MLSHHKLKVYGKGVAVTKQFLAPEVAASGLPRFVRGKGGAGD
jgi:hypothetical protein